MGFKAIDYLTVKLSARMPKEKFDGLIFEAKVGGKKVLLVKPQTFMNDSGICLRQVVDFYKADLKNVAVIYDDIDLPEGKVRLRYKGGPGTHNGMRSVVTHLSSEDFPRIRIGVGAPQDGRDLIDHVLGRPGKESEEIIEHAIALAGDSAIEFIENGMESAMQKFNKES